MALGFSAQSSGSNGDILPIIKWDTKAGDMIRQDRRQESDGVWVKDEAEIAFPVQFIMDMENIEIGYLSFASGAPDFRVAKIGAARPECPPDIGPDGKPAFKDCFRVRLYNKDFGLREFSHTAKTVMRPMDVLHDQYESEKANNPNKVPVVEVSGSEVVKIATPQGELRFKPPVMRITQWVDRPAAMDGNQTPSVPDAGNERTTQAPPPVTSGADLF
jgi:hypothetical protein